ncbi:MAG: manganese efflux pump [Bacilli bacterium]|nr:manganese efflux pump [Bacilli bacterium]
MINVTFISILMSMDLFAISMLLSIKNIFIPIKSYLIIIFFSGITLFVSMLFSYFLKNILSNNTNEIISGLLFIIVGIFSICNNIKIDPNNSKIIESKEAIIMGIFASIDSIAIGINFGIMKYNIVFCVLISSICNFIAIILGQLFKIYKYSFFENMISVIFIIIGIFKITKSLF